LTMAYPESLIGRAQALQIQPRELSLREISRMGDIFSEIFHDASRLIDRFGRTIYPPELGSKELKVDIINPDAPTVSVTLEKRKRRGSQNVFIRVGRLDEMLRIRQDNLGETIEGMVVDPEEVDEKFTDEQTALVYKEVIDRVQAQLVASQTL